MDAKVQASTTRMHESTEAPIDIIFKNLSYTVEMPDEASKPWKKLPNKRKEILKNITGIIQHGKVTAIMGASGAGKTSLLNILACRIDNTKLVTIEGEVLVNNVPYSFSNFGDFANYVMQNDILMQTLTVRETLEFAARLKLNVSNEEREARINRLVNDLKLEKCIDVIVGGTELKGISGGEKKRTSIAFELISDPQVLFLDEPTSGLDSLTAYVIVWYMKRLATTRNKTIAMTIHQPSSQIFELFDNLTLLVAGKLIYQGSARQATDYFGSMGFLAPEFSNPPDYFMSIMHHESKKNVENYPRYFQTYDTRLAPGINNAIENSAKGDYQKRVIDNSTCGSMGTLMSRDFINIRRNPIIVKARVIQTIILGLITGALFWKLSSDYSGGALSPGFNSKNGAFFFLSVSAFMSSLSPIMLTFPFQRTVFLKEQSSKLYSVSAYFFSRNLVELPYLIAIPLLNSIIVYWMIGLENEAGKFFLFNFVCFLCGLAGNSFGLLVGSFFNDPKVASGLLPLIVLPIMLFSGFYKNRADLPVWIGWIEYISPIKYSFIGLTANEYSGTSAPISLLSFDLDLWPAIGVLIGISMVARGLSLFVLWANRGKLQ